MDTIRFHIYIPVPHKGTSRDQSWNLIKNFTQSRIGMMRLRNTYFSLLSSTIVVPFGRPAFPPVPGLIAAAASPGAVTAPAPRSSASLVVATSAPLRAAPAPLPAPAATSLPASAPSAAAVWWGLHRPKNVFHISLSFQNVSFLRGIRGLWLS
jgi:hypothetical protein